MKSSDKNYFGIRDIARIAGVSIASVSRVLNYPELTSKAMRDKVNNVIKQYNYIPNQNAKNLFSQNSNSIAIFIYSIENPFFISLIMTLNNIAFENNKTLLICDTENNPKKEKDYLTYCESIRCNSIILTEGANNNLFSCKKQDQKIAYLDRSTNQNCSSVHSDNNKGIKLLVDYLYNLNHRKIAFAGAMDNLQSSLDRKNTYINSLESYGIEPRKEYIFAGPFSNKTGVEALNYYWSLDDKPTAIICSNDQIASGLIMEAHRLNISIPNDLSVVGFDGIDLGYIYPKLTTIKQNIHKIAQTLYDIVTANYNKTVHEVIDVTLSMGESCKKI